MTISRTFNVVDLFPFHPNDTPLYSEENSGSSSLQMGENDIEEVALYFLDKLEMKRRLKMKRERRLEAKQGTHGLRLGRVSESCIRE